MQPNGLAAHRPDAEEQGLEMDRRVHRGIQEREIQPRSSIMDARLLQTVWGSWQMPRSSVLLQEGQPIAFDSRKFNKAELNYTMSGQEMLALVRTV